MKNSPFRSIPHGLFLTCAVGLISLAPSSAFAAFTKLEGNNGRVNLGESYGPGVFIEYVVDVLGDIRVDGFAVSFEFTPSPPPGIFLIAGNTRSPTWTSRVFTPEQWNDGYDFTVGDETANTLDFPRFDALFGDDPRAALYARPPGSNPLLDSINDDNDHNEGPALWADHVMFENSFFVNSLASSDFIAFTSGGQILDASLFIVPEPTTLAILVMAVALGVATRRGQAYHPCRNHHER